MTDATGGSEQTSHGDYVPDADEYAADRAEWRRGLAGDQSRGGPGGGRPGAPPQHPGNEPGGWGGGPALGARFPFRFRPAWKRRM